MATFEGMGICNESEYERAFDARLRAEQITRGELYVARFRMDRPGRAYRVIGRVGMNMVIENDLYSQFGVQVLNDDLRPVRPSMAEPIPGTMRDGVWNPHEAIVLRKKGDPNVYATLMDACFSDYDEGEWRVWHHDVVSSAPRELDLTSI